MLQPYGALRLHFLLAEQDSRRKFQARRIGVRGKTEAGLERKLRPLQNPDGIMRYFRRSARFKALEKLPPREEM